ncbi:hypothetical protein Tco_0837933 [Tanacetum coccineum]
MRSPCVLKYGSTDAPARGVVVVVAVKEETRRSTLECHVFLSLFKLPTDQLTADPEELEVELALPKYMRQCLSHQLIVSLVGLLRFSKLYSRGVGGIVVVVVIIEVVVVDVGSGESDCIVVRSITEVVIGGTEEVS